MRKYFIAFVSVVLFFRVGYANEFFRSSSSIENSAQIIASKVEEVRSQIFRVEYNQGLKNIEETKAKISLCQEDSATSEQCVASEILFRLNEIQRVLINDPSKGYDPTDKRTFLISSFSDSNCNRLLSSRIIRASYDHSGIDSSKKYEDCIDYAYRAHRLAEAANQRVRSVKIDDYKCISENLNNKPSTEWPMLEHSSMNVAEICKEARF